jgi:hypothetical protein
MGEKGAAMNEAIKTAIAGETPDAGGAISIGRMANLDSLGQGPERIRMGRKVVYRVDSLVEWLAARAEIIERKVS